jgi:hypothetical protein
MFKPARAVVLVLLIVTLIGSMTTMSFIFRAPLNLDQSSNMKFWKKGIATGSSYEVLRLPTNEILPFPTINEMPDQDKTPMSPLSWTVLVYLDGDNDLEEAAFDDFNAMETVGGTAEVNVIVYVDFYDASYAPFTGAKCYNLTKDSDLNSINQVELSTPLSTEPDMGSSNALVDFIVFGQFYAPADNYLLVLWDHGGGFYGICFDDTSGGYPLYPDELASALSSGLIQPIDVVAMDACLMGQLEVAYEIGDYVDYIVFSEDNIPWYGYPYENFLQDLVDTPGTTPADLATNIVTTYIQAYSNGGIYYPPDDTYITLSAIQGSKVEGVAIALDEFTEALLQSTALSTYYEAICHARGLSQSFGWPDFMDLGDFATEASLLIQDITLAGLAQNLSSQTLAAVHFEQHLTGDPGATGLGIAFSTHYSIPLNLITDTHYEEFMTAFLAEAETSSDSILVTDSGTHYGYLEGETDSVYFRFVPEVSNTYTLQLDSMQEYDEDFDLFLYDDEGYEIDSSESIYSSETIQYNFVAGETYYIRAYSYSGSSILFGLGAFSLTITSSSILNLNTIAIILGVIAVIIIIVFCIWRSYSRKQRQVHSWQEEPGYSPYGKPASTQPQTPTPSSGFAGFCSYCGAAIPEGAAFCPNCGHKRK